MTGPVAASVEALTETLRAFFAAEQVSNKDGFLQRRNPRVSVLSIAGLSAAVMITRTPSMTFFICGIALVLAWQSSVPLLRLTRRSRVVPLVSLLIVLPQAVVIPGEPIIQVFGLVISDAGLTYVLYFSLRVTVGVFLLSLLVMTTPFTAIVAAMRELHVPVPLIWVIAITYRYLFLFFDELRRLVLARNSRTSGESTVRDGWRDARGIAGTFLLRTLERGERVGRGMRARGGTRPPSPYTWSMRLDRADYVLLSMTAATIAATVVIRWIP